MRRVPFYILPKVEEEINRMKKEGIIEKVTKSREWCPPMIPVVKKNGKIRIRVDLKRLNEDVKRKKLHVANP